MAILNNRIFVSKKRKEAIDILHDWGQHIAMF